MAAGPPVVGRHEGQAADAVDGSREGLPSPGSFGVPGSSEIPVLRLALRSIDRLFAQAPLGEEATAIIRRERDARAEKLSRS